MTDTADSDVEDVEAPEPEPEPGVPFTVNGVEYRAEPGRNLIDACEDVGAYIPRFCYHPRMSAVGMCRMCLVEVDTGRGPALTPSCMIKASPDMVVDTESENTKAAQDGVLELLLINHPLDCPVCDKGGECPLQDQTMAYGPGESRFVEEKRHFEKPIPISDNVYLDRERCILCDRCTRFADEVAGDPLIHFMGRGNQTQVNTFPDAPFSSYFSGNVVQICPVGALTAKPYRFRARPWDLAEVETTFPNAMGDRITIQSSRNQVLRYQGVDSDAVNWGWLSDRDRFSFEAAMSDARLTEPLVRGSGLNQPDPSGAELVATTWHQALAQAAEFCNEALSNRGPASIAVLGGSRMTNEAQYAWTRLAKGILGTDNVDAQLGDGLPADVVVSMPRATINDVCAPGSTVVLMSGDPKEELGTLYIRLRHAAANDGVKIIELTPTATGLSTLAAHSVRVRPGEIGAVAHALATDATSTEVGGVEPETLAALADAIGGGDLKVIVGRTSLAEDPRPTVEAVSALASISGTTFLPVLRRGNVMGAIDMGMAPGLLPGRTSLDAGRGWFGAHWGQVPAAVGHDAAGILEEAAAGRLELLILLGADPLADFPDKALAERALQGVRRVVAVDMFANESLASRADVVLPAAAFGEHNGTHTNIEGRITTIDQKVTSPGTARADWMIAAELAFKLGADLGIESVEGISAEIEAVSGLHAGADLHVIASERDGVIVPVDGADNSGRPPMFTWTDLGSPADLEPIDAYSWRLVLDRTMFDGGTLCANNESIAGLVGQTAVRLHPTDASQLGVADGSVVRISSAVTSLEVPVVVDEGVSPRVAAIAVNQQGVDPRALVTAGSLVTDVRIENL